MSERNGIPATWARTKIGELAVTRTGGTPSRLVDSYYGGAFPWVKSGELGDGHVYSTEETLTDAGIENSSAKVFPKGTLCVALYGATVGKLGILEIDAATNQAVCGIFLPPQINTKFAFHYLASRRRQFVEQGKGGAQPNISNEIVRETSLPVAPTREQERIVARLEELFSDLDAGVATLERAKANLKRYRASVLKAAVEGRLTADWRAKHKDVEPASRLLQRILTERRQKWEAAQLAKFSAADKSPPKGWKDKYPEPAPPDSSNLIDLPNTWCWTTIEQVSILVTDGDHNPPKRVSTGIPHLTAKNIKRQRINFENCTYISEDDFEITRKRYEPQPDDIIITCVGTVGQVAVVKQGDLFSADRNLAGIRLGHAHVVPTFVEAVLTSPTWSRLMANASGSTAQPHLYLGDIRRIPVPICSNLEQAEFVSAVAEKLSQIEAADIAIDHSLARAARLRQSILNRAFEGRLVPQDLSDESATKLLERIQAERVAAATNGKPAKSRKPTGRRQRAKK